MRVTRGVRASSHGTQRRRLRSPSTSCHCIRRDHVRLRLRHALASMAAARPHGLLCKVHTPDPDAIVPACLPAQVFAALPARDQCSGMCRPWLPAASPDPQASAAAYSRDEACVLGNGWRDESSCARARRRLEFCGHDVAMLCSWRERARAAGAGLSEMFA